MNERFRVLCKYMRHARVNKSFYEAELGTPVSRGSWGWGARRGSASPTPCQSPQMRQAPVVLQGWALHGPCPASMTATLGCWATALGEQLTPSCCPPVC